MAERKPARKAPAKRGPTKAAALKALGLTQEDLNAIKELRELKAVLDKNDLPSPMQSVPQAVRDLVGHQDHPKTGEGPESDHKTEVRFTDSAQEFLEDRQAPVPQQQSLPQSTEDPVFYARNLRHVDVGFRLTRQQKQGEKRTNLKPRGSRGDMIKLEASDLRDPELQTQVNYGLIEVIPEGEALAAIAKQFTNQQTAVPAHIAMLTNAKGEQLYPDQVVMASDEEAYGIKVADLDPALMQGKLSDSQIKRGGGFAQNASQTPTGGNPSIISDGFIAPTQGDSSQMGNNDARSQDVDALARSKQFEGPGAGLGPVTVKVEPVRRLQ